MNLKLNRRPYTNSDFEFVFQLNKINMRKYVEMIRVWDDQSERKELQGKLRVGLNEIIEINGEKVGFLSIVERTEEIYVDHIEFLPSAQNKGLGSKIFQELKKISRDKQKPLSLQVRKENPAVQFYLRHGLKVDSEIETQSKGKKLKMSCPVT